MKLNHGNFSIYLFFAAASIVLGACTGGGGGDVSAEGGGAAGDNPGGAIQLAITSVQGTASTGSGNVYTNAAAVTIEGTCSRGVTTIAATVNGADVAETASCAVNGSFSWTKTFTTPTAETGDAYAVVLKAKDLSGTLISGATASKTVTVDTNAPSTPTVDAAGTWGCQAGSPIICQNATPTITGTYTAAEGVVSYQFPSGGSNSNPAPGATTFSYTTATISPGGSVTLSFTVTDAAGNVSPAVPFTIQYSPTVNTQIFSLNTGGTNGWAGGPVGTAPAMIGAVGSMNVSTTDTNGNITHPMVGGVSGAGAIHDSLNP